MPMRDRNGMELEELRGPGGRKIIFSLKEKIHKNFDLGHFVWGGHRVPS